MIPEEHWKRFEEAFRAWFIEKSEKNDVIIKALIKEHLKWMRDYLAIHSR